MVIYRPFYTYLAKQNFKFNKTIQPAKTEKPISLYTQSTRLSCYQNTMHTSLK